MPVGVQWASFAGGTHIFIKGVGLSEAPEANIIMLESVEMASTIPGPPLSEADIFNSQPVAGHISYRIPSIPFLFNLPEEQFDHY
jgi:hypothetical protein